MNFKRLFDEDVRDKKRIGRGIHNKTGSRGYVGKMMFPSDFMSNKEKKAYMMAGEVEIYNMYDQLMDRAAFDQLDEETQKKTLTRWREIYKNNDIKKSLNIDSDGKLHYLLNKLNVPKKELVRKSKPAKKRTATASTRSKEAPKEAPKPVANKTTSEDLDGFNIRYKGMRSSEQILKILTTIQLVVEDANKDFYIDISFKGEDL